MQTRILTVYAVVVTSVINKVAYIGNQYTIVEPMKAALATNNALNRDVTAPLFICNIFKRNVHFTKMKLGEDAQTIMRLPNAGGNSIHSEALSCDVLNIMFDAKLAATEMELEYFPLGSKITDFSVTIRNQTFGVSVTRAMKYKGVFETEDAERLLTKKLYGVNMSTQAVLQHFKWEKQILHIWAQDKHTADVLRYTYETLPKELKNNTIVLVTICENAPWIFFEKKQ